MCAYLCLESVWEKLWDVWGYREPRSKLPANTNRQHALVYTEHHLYPHISILQAGADSKLGITYNNSVYIVKINNDPACDSLPSLDHAQQCWKAFCFQSFTFKQNMLHAPLIMLFFNLLHPLQQIVGTLGFSANIIYPRLSAPRDGCLLLFLWFV